jgi:hypothetical protein
LPDGREVQCSLHRTVLAVPCREKADQRAVPDLALSPVAAGVNGSKATNVGLHGAKVTDVRTLAGPRNVEHRLNVTSHAHHRGDRRGSKRDVVCVTLL